MQGLFIPDKYAFLFNVNNQKIFSCTNINQAMYTTSGYGPAWGIGDIIISNNIGKSQKVMTSFENQNIGLPNENFKIEEYEQDIEKYTKEFN